MTLISNVGTRLFSLIITISVLVSCVGFGTKTTMPDVAGLEIDNWHELRSTDFVLYSRGEKKDLEAFAEDLARYVAVVERVVQSEPPQTPAQIFLLSGEVEALLIPHPGVGGYMNHSLAGFSGFMRGSIHVPTNRFILLHEFTHYLNLRSRKVKYPHWYSEGFADFLGATRMRGDTMEVGARPPTRLAALERRKRRRDAIDLEEIFAFERNGKRRDPDDFYAISWATVHYLNSNKTRRQQLVSMLELRGAGVPWLNAYARSFSVTIKDLSQKVEAYAEMLNRGTPSAVLNLPLESLDVRNQWTIRPMSEIEILRLLGDFAIRDQILGDTSRTVRVAEALFRRALRIDPGDSRSHAGLAAALSAQERFTESRISLDKFEAASDATAAALLDAGKATYLHALALGKAESPDDSSDLFASSKKFYRRALELDPTNPFAFAGLGRSDFQTKDYDGARESLAKARANGEWDADLTLDQGRVENEAGYRDRARALWKEVIRLGHEEAAKEASELLSKVDQQE